MKKLFYLVLFVSLFGLTVVSCNDDEPNVGENTTTERTDPTVEPSDTIGVSDPNDSVPTIITKDFTFIINYGSSNGTVSTLYTKVINDTVVLKDSLIQNFYELKNGKAMSSKAEYAYKSGEHIYILGYKASQLMVLDTTMVQQQYTIALKNPRACVASGNYLYVSCWGASPDYGAMADSYIAKYDMRTNSLVGEIALPGGPEGVEVANGKLYAALNYKDSVAVVDLSTEVVSYIATPAVTSYFVKDASDNLYVSLVSTYSDPSSTTGLGYINTTTNQYVKTYPINNVSTSYASIMSINNDATKIYLITASYDSSWNLVGGVSVFNIANETYSTFVDNITGINGVCVSPKGEIDVLISPSYSGAGLFKRYTASGSLTMSCEVGVSPARVIY